MNFGCFDLALLLSLPLFLQTPVVKNLYTHMNRGIEDGTTPFDQKNHMFICLIERLQFCPFMSFENSIYDFVKPLVIIVCE